MTDRQIEALRRLLAEASSSPQARADAIVALAQRTVWVVPWEAVEGYRTLVNSSGLAALPVFTTERDLWEAAQRFGWLRPTGEAPRKEIGARAAFGYARDKNLGFVVVDIASAHSIEVAREEFEPILVGGRDRDSQLMAAVARKSESNLAAVSGASASLPGATPGPRSTPGTRGPAPTSRATPATGATPSGPALAAPSTSPVAVLSPQAAEAGLPPEVKGRVLPSTRLFPPASPPDDALLDRLEAILRGYPEVEWACVGSAAASPALGVRVDARMRNRLAALADAVAAASGLVVVTLDDVAHFRAAKTEALVFFPWRR